MTYSTIHAATIRVGDVVADVSCSPRIVESVELCSDGSAIVHLEDSGLLLAPAHVPYVTLIGR